MRSYAAITSTFWLSPTGRRLRAAGMKAQIVALYLLTSPNVTAWPPAEIGART